MRNVEHLADALHAEVSDIFPKAAYIKGNNIWGKCNRREEVFIAASHGVRCNECQGDRLTSADVFFPVKSRLLF